MMKRDIVSQDVRQGVIYLLVYLEQSQKHKVQRGELEITYGGYTYSFNHHLITINYFTNSLVTSYHFMLYINVKNLSMS